MRVSFACVQFEIQKIPGILKGRRVSMQKKGEIRQVSVVGTYVALHHGSAEEERLCFVVFVCEESETGAKGRKVEK